MKFHTTLELHGKSATGLVVPPAIVEALSDKKNPPVKVTIGGHTYRSSVASRGGQFLVGVSAENRKAAVVAAGDEVEVDIELDTEPREVVVPADLAAALAADKAAQARFDKLSFSHQRQHVEAIESAKAPETRQRRIDKAIEKLNEG